MKPFFYVLILLAPLSVLSQQQGIRFEHGLTWNEIKDKAKAENKYIFVDCYTTWCAPCMYMAQKVFTEPEVGDYFNQHFLNIKLQLNKTPSDDEEVKNGTLTPKR